jgi:hypothetical protein
MSASLSLTSLGYLGRVPGVTGTKHARDPHPGAPRVLVDVG